MKADHYTSSLQPYCLLPTPLWMSIVWHFGSELKSSSGYNLPIVQWRCRLQFPRSLAFMSCKFAALYTSIRCHQTQHATTFYIWTSPLCSSCACICMSISLCRYRFLIFFLFFFLHIYIYTYAYVFLYYRYLYVFYIFLYLYFILSNFLARFKRTCSAPILFTALPVSRRTAAVSLHCRKKGSGDMRRLSTSLHVSKLSSPMWPLVFVQPPLSTQGWQVWKLGGIIPRKKPESVWRDAETMEILERDISGQDRNLANWI